MKSTGWRNCASRGASAGVAGWTIHGNLLGQQQSHRSIFSFVTYTFAVDGCGSFLFQRQPAKGSAKIPMRVF
jgi:hypothetical protein